MFLLLSSPQCLSVSRTLFTSHRLEARNFKALRRRLRCQGYLYLRDVIPRDVVARTRVVVAEGLDSVRTPQHHQLNTHALLMDLFL